MDGFARSEDTFSFANAKRGRFQRYWRAAIDQIISRRKTSLTAPAHRDLLDLLLSVRDTETGPSAIGPRNPRPMRNHVFCGVRSTARLLFWACYLLAMDFEEQTRVREEVTAFRPKRIDGPDDLQNWRRLRNVLLKALRLLPPVPQMICTPMDRTKFAAKKLAHMAACIVGGQRQGRVQFRLGRCEGRQRIGHEGHCRDRVRRRRSNERVDIAGGSTASARSKNWRAWAKLLGSGPL